MLYGNLRIVFWAILLIFALLLTKKRKFVKKKLINILAIILSIVLCSVSSFLPVENLFITFRSPKDVFNYTRFGIIENIIHGKDSCMVNYLTTNDSRSYLFVSKIENGYKILTWLNEKNVFHKFSEEGTFDVYNILRTNDYYVLGMISSEEDKINIVDNNNKEVQKIITEVENTKIKHVIFYAFVENFTNDYFILVNDKKIFFSN